MAGINNQGYGYNNSQQGIPIQYPYGNNNLIMNTPYENYIGRNITTNNGLNLNSNQYLKCRPVSSKEQARAMQIDLDGSLWVFTDIGNQKIYTKQINNDGTATFKTYALAADENPYVTPEYVTKDEFNKVIQSLMAAIQPVQNVSNESVKKEEKNTPIANF